MSDELDSLDQDNLPALNLNALPAKETGDAARRIAASTLADPLPPSAYAGAGTLPPLTPEQEAMLDEPLPEDEVDIRPDGLIYASHEYCRRKLNKVFGRLQWALVPGSPVIGRACQDRWGKKYQELCQRWVLLVKGVYAAEALASRAYWPDNASQSYDDPVESIKSDCIRRVCKDLGIAHECWNRRWAEAWRSKFAVQVLVHTERGNVKRWRRRDALPFEGEISMSDGSQAKSEPKLVVKTEEGRRAEQPPSASKAAAAESAGVADSAKVEDPQPDAKSPSSTGLHVTEGQLKLLLVEARKAGLVEGDSAREWCKYLRDKCGISAAGAKGQTSMGLAVMMMKQLPGGQAFSKLITDLRSMKKPDQPTDAPEGEDQIV